MDTPTYCQSCDGAIEWHARKAEYLEQTVGPDAARQFEDDHPEAPALSPMALRVAANKAASRRTGGERPMGWDR